MILHFNLYLIKSDLLHHEYNEHKQGIINKLVLKY